MNKKVLLANFDYYGELYFTYGTLLTEKQNEVLEAYFEYNLSLREIADNLDISGSAVYDTIRKSIAKLEIFERNIRLVVLKKDLDEIITKQDRRELAESEFVKRVKEIRNGI